MKNYSAILSDLEAFRNTNSIAIVPVVNNSIDKVTAPYPTGILLIDPHRYSTSVMLEIESGLTTVLSVQVIFIALGYEVYILDYNGIIRDVRQDDWKIIDIPAQYSIYIESKHLKTLFPGISPTTLREKIDVEKIDVNCKMCPCCYSPTRYDSLRRIDYCSGCEWHSGLKKQHKPKMSNLAMCNVCKVEQPYYTSLVTNAYKFLCARCSSVIPGVPCEKCGGLAEEDFSTLSFRCKSCYFSMCKRKYRSVQ